MSNWIYSLYFFYSNFMSDSVTIKGQAWIYDNSQVLQDQTLITANGTSENTVILVDDIWEDLTTVSGKWKQANGSKGYFYWEYKQTDTASQLADGSYSEVTIKLECPRPKPGFIESFFLDENGFPTNPRDWSDDDIKSKLDSDWAIYWANQLRDADYNYNKVGSLQKKEVTFISKETISFDKDTAGDVITKTTVTEEKPMYGSDDNLIIDLINLF